MLDSRFWILDGCDGSLVNLVNMVNLVKWFRPRKAGFRQTDAGSLTLTRQKAPDLRYLRTMLFGVYLLIRKRAVLCYICRLLAVYVCLLANIQLF